MTSTESYTLMNKAIILCRVTIREDYLPFFFHCPEQFFFIAERRSARVRGTFHRETETARFVICTGLPQQVKPALTVKRCIRLR